ncbi:uncharacterized protein Z519_02165 [Cladophialophora bantiana CBS 173.52]|uniref:Oxidoreductase n=1 Tax=Cladophialophora bantiana (strain ATCC 10958 / CBS 173.52 / CDC B-1940 / NIH 8579) TaxID=1442370 RepID=A0A0D2IJ22_CLAB1|nr:uncharacterized protein Z519_02165 [Cladophialophora bantiana CBS 173.52]KIW96774.1 hypothetical protein Z519_02165 [Cladophialophora bantiana CBS 173.52]
MSLHPSQWSVAWVSGAGSGIGRAIALQLFADGFRKMCIVDVNESNLKATAENIKSKYPDAEVISVPVNITEDSEVRVSIDATVQQFGRLDCCVNAAGIAGPFSKTDSQTTTSLDTVLGVDLRGLWLCERAQLCQLMKQDLRPLNTQPAHHTRGVIINISSMLGTVGMPLSSPYNMAKHGVIGLTRTDAIDYAEAGIRVIAVCPGFCRSNLVDAATWDALGPVIQQTPMKRLGTVEEIAYSVSFLASDRSSYTTGIAYCIDGGFTSG